MGIIQINAIRSWLSFCPPAEVLLLGDDEGTAEVAHQFGVRHIPKVARNEQGTPLISSLFQSAEEVAKHNVLCQINGDIMLTDDFFPALEKVCPRKQKYLLTGQRWDVEIGKPWDFDQPNWGTKLRELARERGTLHPAWGLDYFIYPKGVWGQLPPFSIGRQRFDNWLIYLARSLGVPVIDATKAITAIHQNHDYSFHPQGEPGVKKGPEAQRNLELAGGWAHIFSLDDATHILTSTGVIPALGRKHLERRIKTLPLLHPDLWRWVSPAVPLLKLIGKIWK